MGWPGLRCLTFPILSLSRSPNRGPLLMPMTNRIILMGWSLSSFLMVSMSLGSRIGSTVFLDPLAGRFELLGIAAPPFASLVRIGGDSWDFSGTLCGHA